MGNEEEAVPFITAVFMCLLVTAWKKAASLMLMPDDCAHELVRGAEHYIRLIDTYMATIERFEKRT